jgi:hypothetical protein
MNWPPNIDPGCKESQEKVLKSEQDVSTSEVVGQVDLPLSF